MRLRVVPARNGLLWVGAGVRTFMRQPLAMSGLFFLLMATLSGAALIPVLGLPLALVLLPACTLGMMAAARQAQAGQFPLPFTLFVGLRAGGLGARRLLQLGALYALGFALALGATVLVDGGHFVQFYTRGIVPDPAVWNEGGLIAAMWTFIALHLPISLLFWHAPALVHWHAIAPLQALFYSAVACWRNRGAMTLYGLGWLGAMLGLVLLASLSGLAAPGVMMALLMGLAAMFFSSLYTTFAECFETDDGPPAA